MSWPNCTFAKGFLFQMPLVNVIRRMNRHSGVFFIFNLPVQEDIGVDVGIGLDKMLKFYIKVFM